MSIPGFQEEKCLKRNRVAARRDGLTAAPVRFLATDDFAASTSDGPGAAGKIQPLCTDSQALAKINAARPGEESLTADDVYIHYIEAASSSFIGDRYMFLGTSTLKNIARDATAGFAFMNSHRTGGLSHPAELPFGRTFTGRYEKGDPGQLGSERTLVGFYMLRGLKPNGDGGPSTDDLHRMIDGGTLFDVSVGLYGGTDVCDVCGNDVDAYDPDEGYLCAHVPGTHYRMTADEMTAQKERGVPDGKASSTLSDSGCGEVSGVFDGAVPGAGFRKALSLARCGVLDKTASAQARQAYSRLLSKGELEPMDGQGIIAAITEGFDRLGKDLGLKSPAATPPPAPPAPASPAVDPALLSRLNEQETQLAQANAQIENLRKEGEQREKEGQERERAAQLAASQSWIEAQTKAFKITPAAGEHFAKLAAEHPAAFELAKLAVEANPVISALAGDGKDGKTVDGTALAGGGDSAAQSTQLNALTKKYQAEHPGTSYADALSLVCIEHKDLAAAYHASVSGGN